MMWSPRFVFKRYRACFTIVIVSCLSGCVGNPIPHPATPDTYAGPALGPQDNENAPPGAAGEEADLDSSQLADGGDTSIDGNVRGDQDGSEHIGPDVRVPGEDTRVESLDAWQG